MDESPPAPHPPPTAHDRSRRIVREPDDRRIAGVCSGLADHLGIDVTVMRVTAVVLALVTHLALIAYLVASVALPERPADQPRVRAQNVHLGQVPHPLIVVGAIVAVAVLVDDGWWLEPFPAAVALVGIGVWLVVVNREEVSLGGRTPGPGGGSDISGAEASHGRGDGGVAGDDSDPDSDPSVTPSPDAAPEDAPTASDVMPAGPGVVSVSQHSSTVGDGSTTLTDEPFPNLSEQPSLEGTGPSGELPPPASPWWSGHPAAAPGPVPRTAATPPRASSAAGAIVMALLLIGAGTLWLLAATDVVEVELDDVLALALLVVGVGLLVTSWRGRGYGLVPLGLVLAGTLVAGEAIDIPLRAGVGDRTVIVDSVAELDTRHEMFAGDMTIDLTDAPLRAGRTTEVEAAVAAGELRVIVPRDAVVEVTATARAGGITSPGGPEANEDGLFVDSSFTLEAEPPDDAEPNDATDSARPDPPRLELDLSVGVGEVEVTRG